MLNRYTLHVNMLGPILPSVKVCHRILFWKEHFFIFMLDSVLHVLHSAVGPA